MSIMFDHIHKLPCFFKNKCEYYTCRYEFNKLGSLNDVNDSTDDKFTNDMITDELKDYLLYKPCDPIILNENIFINTVTIKDIFFNYDHPSLFISKLSTKKKICLYYLIQYNIDIFFKFIQHHGWHDLKFSKIEPVYITYNYDIYNINYINFGCFYDKYKIKITKKILEKTQFKKILMSLLLFELSFNMFKLDSLPRVSLPNDWYNSNHNHIFDRYICIKILAQILVCYKYFDYELKNFDLNKLCIKILNEKETYWPSKCESIELYNASKNLYYNNKCFPEFSLGSVYVSSNNIFNIDIYHFKPITYHADVLLDLYKCVNIKFNIRDVYDGSMSYLLISVLSESKNQNLKLGNILFE
jgi:hypothetical protein